MIVVSDAGPLMALAKVGGLEALFRLFPSILTPPAVYEELITAGMRLGAADVPLLQARYQCGDLTVAAPTEAAMPVPALLGAGEVQSLLLAIEKEAAWLLVDDLDARQAAIATISAVGSTTQVKGTLGIILTAWQESHLSQDEAARIVEALRSRPDVWISSALCDRVLQLLGDSRT